MRFSPLAFLFSVAMLCGLAFSFLLWPRGASLEPAEPAVGADEAYRVATQLVERRDAALMAGDAEALASLTVEGSAARAADERLLASLGDVTALETVVMDVSLRSQLEWEVKTVQYAYEGGDGAKQEGPLPERCTRWMLERDPWRLAQTAPCGD